MIEDFLKKGDEEIIENFVFLTISKEGNLGCITSKQTTEEQEELLQKILIISENHSLILKIVLWLEIKFYYINYISINKIKSFFKKQ
tara:strand:+ start:1417 stop:1677 length:261 start_codon:yes stop_codon:yes gene_type:complete